MLSRLNGAVWMEDGVKDSTTKSNDFNSSCGMMERKEEMGSISGFKSMLEVEDDWFVTNNSIHNQQDITFSPNLGDPDNLLLHSLDSSASCSPSSSVFNNLNPSQVPYFMHQKPTLSSLLNVVSSHPLENGFSLGEIGFLENQATISANASTLMNGRGEVLENFSDFSSSNQMNTPNLCSELQLPENGPGFTGFRGFDDNSVDTLFFNRSKLLRPLGTFPSMGAQPTLFQKRAALRMNFSDNNNNNDKLWALGGIEKDKGKTEMAERSEENERKKRKLSSGDDIVGDVSIDGSGFNYDSDELTETIKVEDFGKNEGNSSNANSSITEGGVCGDGNQHKGKKKGLPAKNLMAERRRRKKLNDRLYMLRSIVPKISKMDRASILGDAIEYLKELLQKINDLHNELESTPTGSMVPTTSFHPLTPTNPSALSNRMKEKLCPGPLPSPTSQPANVEVRFREGRSVNIHMFCGRRPGLLLSTVRALENLGLDIQQAVISCFNGFTMDIFHAEKCGPDLRPEQIKATLIDSAGLLGL